MWKTARFGAWSRVLGIELGVVDIDRTDWGKKGGNGGGSL